MYRASDAMNREVVCLRPEATVEEAIRLLLKREISGAPVVDGDGQLVGIISEFQLLEVLYSPELKAVALSEFMTRDVLTVGEQTLLSDVVSLMIAHRIRRVPVVSEGRVVGLLTRRDLLRYAMEDGQAVRDFIDGVRSLVV